MRDEILSVVFTMADSIMHIFHHISSGNA